MCIARLCILRWPDIVEQFVGAFGAKNLFSLSNKSPMFMRFFCGMQTAELTTGKVVTEGRVSLLSDCRISN
jgi:hypothetical protein